jgi:AcrR family transcriptional regulator
VVICRIAARKSAEDAELTRQNLVAAGIQVFAEHGYAGTILEMVSQRAGVTRGAVYWHFKGKDALLRTVLDDCVLPLENFLDHGASFEEEMAQLCRAMSRTLHHQQSRQICELMLQKSERVAELSPVALRLHDAQNRFHEQLKALLGRGVSRGELHANLDVRVSSQILQVCFTGLIVECLRQPLESTHHLESTLNALCVMFKDAFIPTT